MSQHSSDFLGTERFRIRRRLGSGGMGVVYEAHDRETDKVVALKTLTRAEASHISRFKNEFRSLADVSHPNLVALYEFMADGQYWFFTMELVQGINFLEYVRPGYHAKHLQSSKTPTLRKSRKIPATSCWQTTKPRPCSWIPSGPLTPCRNRPKLPRKLRSRNRSWT